MFLLKELPMWPDHYNTQDLIVNVHAGRVTYKRCVHESAHVFVSINKVILLVWPCGIYIRKA